MTRKPGVLATGKGRRSILRVKAIALATKACELTKYKEAHIVSTLAAGYAEKGDFKTAIKWSLKAVDLGEGETKENLKKELKSYQAGKPWRERFTADE